MNRSNLFAILVLFFISVLIVVEFSTTRSVLQKKREQLNDLILVSEESERVLQAMDRERNKEKFQTNSTHVTLLMEEKNGKLNRMKNLIQSLQLEIALLESSCESCEGTLCDSTICLNVKLTQTSPTEPPTMLSRDATSITLTADSTMEFRMGSGEWQESNVFSNLTAGTSYTFTRRLRGNATHDASGESASVSFTTINYQWNLLSPSGSLPTELTARDGHTSVIYNNSMYIFGGWDGTYRNDLWEYDISNNQWNQISPSGSLPTQPTARYGHTSVIYNGTMYIFGGTDVSHGSKNDLWEYNFSNKKWNLITPSGTLPTARNSHTSVIYNNSMYILGGAHGSPRNDLWEFNFSNKKWTELSPITTARNRHTSVVHNDRMYMFGGGGDGNTNDLWEYDISNNQWNLITPSGTLPTPRNGHTSVIYNDRMYMFGGSDSTRKNDLWEYNFSNKKWMELSPSGTPPTLPTARYMHTSVIYNGAMYMFGGSQGTLNSRIKDFWEIMLH